MTPKQKAKELINKICEISYNLDGNKNPHWAKDILINTIDEILKESIKYEDYGFYQEVKEEIEKL